MADGVFHAPSAQEPVQVLQSYLLHTLRARVLGQEALVPLARVSEKMLAELFSSAVRLKLTGILGKVATLRSSRDALNLAQATIDLLEAASKTKGIPQHDPAGVQMEGSHSQRQVKPGPEGGRNLATGGNGSSHKRFSEKTREKPVPTGDAIHKGRGADSGDTQEGATDSCSNEESPGLEANSSRETRKASIEHRDSSGADALQAILNAAPGDFLPDFGGLLSQQLRKFASRCHRPAVGIETAVLEGPPSATAAEGKALIQDVQIQTRALRTKLGALVQASRLDRPHLSWFGQRVDTRQLHKLAVHDSRVFDRTRRRQAVNTAVLILLDASSSMKGIRIEVARRSALAAALALQSIPGTAVSCVAFGRSRSVLVLTPFGERIETTAHRYAAIAAEGSTPLTEALWWCAGEILRRREERKLVLVITDGEPNDLPSAQSVIQWFHNTGIETFGLGIELPSIHTLFPTSEVIRDIHQLPGALFHLLEKSMTRPANRHIA